MSLKLNNKSCPHCYGNLVMFNSDLDICDSCKRQFFPGESA